MNRALLVAVCLLALSCSGEESRLTIANSPAICAYITLCDESVQSALLITYTGGKAKITLSFAERVRNETVFGEIDMLGRKTFTAADYPLRFDFVMEHSRVHFIQRKPGPIVEIITP